MKYPSAALHVIGVLAQSWFLPVTSAHEISAHESRLLPSSSSKLFSLFEDILHKHKNEDENCEEDDDDDFDKTNPPDHPSHYPSAASASYYPSAASASYYPSAASASYYPSVSSSSSYYPSSNSTLETLFPTMTNPPSGLSDFDNVTIVEFSTSRPRTSESDWQQTEIAQGNGNFGSAVSVSADGTRAVVRNDESFFIYKLGSGGWEQEGETFSWPKKGFVNLWNTVAISGNGKAIIVGGGKDGNTYKVKTVFLEEEGEFVLESQKGMFGISVSISDDSSRALIGSHFDNQKRGSVTVYDYTDGKWTEMKSIDGQQVGELFGFSSALSGNGKRFAVGAYGWDKDNNKWENYDTGYVEVYEYNKDAISKWVRVGAIKGAMGYQQFGHAVAISYDGSRVVIGSKGGQLPEVWELKNGDLEKCGDLKPPVTLLQNHRPGYSVDISYDGRLVAFNAQNFGNSGAVFLFEDIGSTCSWTYVETFLGEKEDHFGADVKLIGNKIQLVASSSLKGYVMNFKYAGTSSPTLFPTTHPSLFPSLFPTTYPSYFPTKYLSAAPSTLPSSSPSETPCTKDIEKSCKTQMFSFSHLQQENPNPNPTWPNDFKWSFHGKPDGYDCIQIYEHADEIYWNDNYFCWDNTKIDPGFEWSQTDGITNEPGKRCTRIYEPKDTGGTWGDNYLCIPEHSPLNFEFISEGNTEGKACIEWNEPADPNGWNDGSNFLCTNYDYYKGGGVTDVKDFLSHFGMSAGYDDNEDKLLPTEFIMMYTAHTVNNSTELVGLSFITSEARYLGPFGSNGLLKRTEYTEQVSFSPPFEEATIAGYFTEGTSIGFYWDKSSGQGGSLAAMYANKYCKNTDCSITPATDDGSGNSVSTEYLFAITSATGGLLLQTSDFIDHLIDETKGFGIDNPNLKKAFKFMKAFSHFTLAVGLISAFFPSGPSEIKLATQEILEEVKFWGEKILNAIHQISDILKNHDVKKELDNIRGTISSMDKQLDPEKGGSLSYFRGGCKDYTQNLWMHFNNLYDHSCLEDEFCTLAGSRPSYEESWVGIVRNAAENEYKIFINSYSKMAISLGVQLLELYSLCAPEDAVRISMMEVGIVEMTQQLSDFVYRTKTAPGLGETCLATPAKDCKAGLFCADNNNKCCKNTYTKNGKSHCGGKVYGEKCSGNDECEGDLKCFWEYNGGGKKMCCDESYDDKYCKKRVWDICPSLNDKECMGGHHCARKMKDFDRSFGCCPHVFYVNSILIHCDDWFDFVEGYDADSNLFQVETDNGRNWNHYEGRLAVSVPSMNNGASYGFSTDMYVKGNLNYDNLKKIDYGYRGDIDRTRGLYINRTRKILWHLGFANRDKYPQWPGDFHFSNSGNLGSDWNCVNVGVPNVGVSMDNWFCEKKKALSHGIKWSTNGPLGGKRCTKIEEPAMPGFYENTYLCVDHSSPLYLSWSLAGITTKDHCQQWYEATPGWNDNYLCADKDPFPQWPDEFRYSNGGNYFGSGWNCVNVGELNVGVSMDNYFCEKKKALSHGIEWSTNGPIDGKRCTKIEEPAMPGFYENTYLCVNHSSPLHLSWSEAGPDKKTVKFLDCQKWYEATPSWDDNYLCAGKYNL